MTEFRQAAPANLCKPLANQFGNHGLQPDCSCRNCDKVFPCGLVIRSVPIFQEWTKVRSNLNKFKVLHGFSSSECLLSTHIQVVATKWKCFSRICLSKNIGNNFPVEFCWCVLAIHFHLSSTSFSLHVESTCTLGDRCSPRQFT